MRVRFFYDPVHLSAFYLGLKSLNSPASCVCSWREVYPLVVVIVVIPSHPKLVGYSS
jgi:hypothetical protein